MKKLLLITGIILTVYLVMTAVVTNDAPEPSAAEANSVVSASDDGYLISQQDGFVVIYKGGELFLKTDTTVDSLPKSDRVKIEEGVHVSSLKELKELIEDYCS